MEWLFEVEIQNANIFDELEIRTNYKYPDDFKSVALKFNGATPKCNTFDTKETEGRVFNYLISLNKNKEEMEEIIWDYFGAVVFASIAFATARCIQRRKHLCKQRIVGTQFSLFGEHPLKPLTKFTNTHKIKEDSNEQHRYVYRSASG